MLGLTLVGCTEPPPPVAAFILDRVTTERATVSLGSRSAEVVVARVPGGFYTNTARPVLGRTFSDADYTTSPSVSIISYALWERFGSGESSAPLIMNGKSYEVIGVMPEGFDIPPDAQVWIPL
jgi:MacB-like periplasmic core domain